MTTETTIATPYAATRHCWTDWGQRHNTAISDPKHAGEVYVSNFIDALHALECGIKNNGYTLGKDYAMEPLAKQMIESFIGTLNFDLGTRLDLGTLDKWARDFAAQNDITLD